MCETSSWWLGAPAGSARDLPKPPTPPAGGWATRPAPRQRAGDLRTADSGGREDDVGEPSSSHSLAGPGLGQSRSAETGTGSLATLVGFLGGSRDPETKVGEQALLTVVRSVAVVIPVLAAVVIVVYLLTRHAPHAIGPLALAGAVSGAAGYVVRALASPRGSADRRKLAGNPGLRAPASGVRSPERANSYDS